METDTTNATNSTSDARIHARDAAARLLNRITAGVAFGAVAGVGLLGVVSAYTAPSIVSDSSGATASTSSSSGSTSTGLQSSTGGVSSSTGSGVAVSGGS
jgi:hypothetical protein